MLVNQVMRDIEGRYIALGGSQSNKRPVLIDLMAKIEKFNQSEPTEEAALQALVGSIDDMLDMWGEVVRFRSERSMLKEIRAGILDALPQPSTAG